MAFKDLYVSQVPKTQSLFQQAAHQALARALTRDLRLTPPLCNYFCSPSTWDLQFSSASQLGASMRMVLRSKSWFRLGEVEPSFKKFLASPANAF